MKYEELIVLDNIPFRVKGTYENYNHEHNRFDLEIEIESAKCGDSIEFINVVDFWKIQQGTVNITLYEKLIEGLQEAIPERIKKRKA